MDNLGEFNLFIKQFVIGCKECNKDFTKTETTEIEAAHKWIEYKDNNRDMGKYRSERTQYIAYLEIIELNEFKGIVNDIYKNYVTKYPYSTKKDFIDQVFRHTIYDLEQFLERDLLWLWATPEEDSYTYYTCFLSSEKEFVDFAINNKYEIEHYRQYYRAVLEFLKSFEGQDNTLLQQKDKSKYKELINAEKNEENNSQMHLPELEDSIIVHYGSEMLNEVEHLIYCIAGISHKPNKTYFFGDNTVTSGGPKTETEIKIIEKFKNYIDNNQNKTFIHWSMQKPDWGFEAIASRYYQLTNKAIDLSPKNVKDLSEYLKNKYGRNYMEHPRLNNLAVLNNFSGFQKEKVVKTKHDNVNRLELLFSIVQADIQGTLKTNNKTPQQNTKQIPKPNEALISFRNTEIINSLHNELKGYFKGFEAELKKALKGEQINDSFLLFPSNQNKFVEVFKRLKYNGFLLSTPKEIKDWICSTFTFQHQKGKKKEVRKFNTSTVHDILTKDKGEPSKKERICIVDWLPYKTYETRRSEAENEKI
mgnify:CR=1 FL=1